MLPAAIQTYHIANVSGCEPSAPTEVFYHDGDPNPDPNPDPGARTQVKIVAGRDDELRCPLERQLAHQRRHLALIVLALPAPVANLQVRIETLN